MALIFNLMKGLYIYLETQIIRFKTLLIVRNLHHYS